MSCGPLNGALTSSVEASVLTLYSLGSIYDNEFSPRTPNIDLYFNITSPDHNGFLTSSLQCDTLILYFGGDKAIRKHGYNLQAELSSSMPLQACLFTEAVYIP